MKKWIFLGIILAFALLQATILNRIRIFNVKPDLLLISAIGASIFFPARWAIFFGITSGILKDVFCGYTFGINTVLFTFSGLLVIKVSKKISLDHKLVRAILGFVIVFINAVIVQGMLIFTGNFIPWGVFLRIAILESLYTALILPYALLRLGLLL